LLPLANHADKFTAYGRKFLPGENPLIKKDNFQLFYNRVGLGDNTILVLHEGNKTLYLDYNVLDYLATTDEHFCNQVHRNMKAIMRTGTLISSVSEKQRNMFFNLLCGKLPLQKLKMERKSS